MFLCMMHGNIHYASVIFNIIYENIAGGIMILDSGLWMKFIMY